MSTNKTNKLTETVKIFRYMWPVEFRKSKIFIFFFIFLTKIDKKLDTKNFRMIVGVVCKICKNL